MKSIRCWTLFLVVFGALSQAAHAALIHDLQTSDGTSIGRIEFDAPNPTELSDVIVADITLGGVAFTIDQLFSVTGLSISDEWLLSGVFMWGSPNFSNFAMDGYNFILEFSDGQNDGFGVLISAACQGACLTEAVAVNFSADANFPLTVVPLHVPEPSALALLGLGLAGLGYSRRKKV